MSYIASQKICSKPTHLISLKLICNQEFYGYHMLRGRSLCGVMAKVSDCGLDVSELELQSRY